MFKTIFNQLSYETAVRAYNVLKTIRRTTLTNTNTNPIYINDYRSTNNYTNSKSLSLL